MYVVVSLEYLEKFILPIDEKSGRYIDGRAWLRPQFSAMVQGPATLVHRGNSVHGP
jgi:hypothetical protein